MISRLHAYSEFWQSVLDNARRIVNTHQGGQRLLGEVDTTMRMHSRMKGVSGVGDAA